MYFRMLGFRTRALAAVAREMNRSISDWQRLGAQQHLALAVRALDDGGLPAACAAMLFGWSSTSVRDTPPASRSLPRART
jgi:hypothetical protein